jgi:uroporphyrinogen decarboxylase
VSIHKERVRAFFARSHADRVPLNYHSNPGIDKRLKALLGLASDDDDGLALALDLDFRQVGAWWYTGPPVHAEVPDRSIDWWGARKRWIEHSNGGYWDFCDFPLRDATLEDVERWPMPDPDLFDYATISERCRQHADFGLILGDAGQGDCINASGMVRSADQVMLDIGERNPALLRLIDRRNDIQLKVLERILESNHSLIDGLWMGEDLGTQIGPMISRKTYRELLAPRHQRFIDLAQAYGKPIMIHCCGSSSWAFDDFARMGMSAVDTLQPEARQMAPAYLKATYGDRLAFHGGWSTAGKVVTGTVAEAEADARAILDAYMPGGGYAFAPTHQLQDNTPAENVLACYAVARDLGRYTNPGLSRSG